MAEVRYTDDNIRTLEGIEHIRRRPGMYIGRLGNGDNPGDGIYVLLKEIVDNSIDEFSMGFGKQVKIDIAGNEVTAAFRWTLLSRPPASLTPAASSTMLPSRRQWA